MTTLMIPGPPGAGDQVLQTMVLSPLAVRTPRAARPRGKARSQAQDLERAAPVAVCCRPSLRTRLAAVPRMLMAGLHGMTGGSLRGRA